MITRFINVESNRLKIITDIPDSKLSANRTKGRHYLSTLCLIKKQREKGYYAAFEAHKKQPVDFNDISSLALYLTVYFANDKHLDDDNLLSSLKSFRDGVFDFLSKKFTTKNKSGKIVSINDRMITYTVIDTARRDKINPRIGFILSPRYATIW